MAQPMRHNAVRSPVTYASHPPDLPLNFVGVERLQRTVRYMPFFVGFSKAPGAQGVPIKLN